MPAVYEKLGIRFQYPENWTLDEIEALEGNDSVTVYSPGGGFWSIMIHPQGTPPAELVDAALEAMREQYDELDVESVAETIAGRELVGYDMHFFCLDLTNTALVRGFATEQGTYVVFYQAEDIEFSGIELVFRAITLSLLR
jgi:hypothetical protein